MKTQDTKDIDIEVISGVLSDYVLLTYEDPQDIEAKLVEDAGLTKDEATTALSMFSELVNPSGIEAGIQSDASIAAENFLKQKQQ